MGAPHPLIRVLLDTHVLLWALFSPEKLSSQVVEIIEDPANVRLVSSVTAFEISTKYKLGKLAVAARLLPNYHDHLKHFQALELALTSRHSLLAGTFLSEHRDPFDRLLAAQSEIEGVPLITKDSAFKSFPIHTIW